MTVTSLPPTATRVGVVERVTQILDAFADAPGHLLLEDVVRITRLPRSTAFRILGQLIDQGWINHGPRGYALGSRLPALSGRDQDQEEVRAAANEHLNALQVRTDAVVHLSVLEGGFVRYVDKVGGRAASSVPSRVGARLVATDTVSGRALLATLPPESVDRVLSEATGAQLTPQEQRRVHADLALVRTRGGIALQNAVGPRGITSVGAPVWHRRQPVAAVSLAWRGPLSSPASISLLRMTTAAIERDLAD